VTVAGEVTLQRGYFRCSKCQQGHFPLDERLGNEGLLSRRAERLVCLAAASWSYDRAAVCLHEFCGLRISDTTIRARSQEQGAKMRRWQQESPEASAAFQSATGEVEFATDGTAVNTTEGWREMRLSLFAKRSRGRPANLHDWEERNLPSPHARVVFAGLRRAETLGPQWRRWAGRLGLKQTNELTVLADGARWIWKQVNRWLPGACGVLDIYHASEHLYQTAAVLEGEQTPRAQTWVEKHRQCLLEGGADALLKALSQEYKQRRSLRQRASLDSLSAYFRPHRDHTSYQQRLTQGQTIGSGIVEGACKTVVARRLKQTGARWRIRRVERMAALCCLLYGDQWNTYWTTRAA
jgi:hypothetical protein